MLDKEYIKNNELTIRDEIVSEAYKWLNAKYHHLGMVEYKAADCMTLLVQIGKKVGILEYDPSYYPPDFLFHRGEETYLKGVSDHCHRTDQYKKGNIILYKMGRIISHAAIIVDYPKIIHAVANVGIVLDDASQDYLKKKEMFIYSFWEDNNVSN